MNGVDLLLMVGVAVLTWFGYGWLQRRDRPTEVDLYLRRRAELDAEQTQPASIRELVNHGNVYDQDDEVPLEWLDQLDALKRLPETGRGL